MKLTISLLSLLLFAVPAVANEGGGGKGGEVPVTKNIACRTSGCPDAGAGKWQTPTPNPVIGGTTSCGNSASVTISYAGGTGTITTNTFPCPTFIITYEPYRPSEPQEGYCIAAIREVNKFNQKYKCNKHFTINPFSLFSYYTCDPDGAADVNVYTNDYEARACGSK